jgi:phage replication O-like protein O
MALAQKVVSLEDHKEKFMGKPQTEDGYTRIANELLEAIIGYDFSSRHLKVILAIIRKTYGFNKKADEIGLSQLRDITSIDRGNVSRTVNQLSLMKVLIVTEGYNARTISLNKKYKEWVLPEQQQLPKQQLLPKSGLGVANLAFQVLPEQQPQYTYTKETKERGETSPKKATSFPAKFEISETNIRIAGEANVSAIDELGKFEDFHTAKGSKFANWNSAFNNWLRKAGEFKTKDNPTQAKTIGGMKVGKNWC